MIDPPPPPIEVLQQPVDAVADPLLGPLDEARLGSVELRPGEHLVGRLAYLVRIVLRLGEVGRDPSPRRAPAPAGGRSRRRPPTFTTEDVDRAQFDVQALHPHPQVDVEEHRGRGHERRGEERDHAPAHRHDDPRLIEPEQDREGGQDPQGLAEHPADDTDQQRRAEDGPEPPGGQADGSSQRGERSGLLHADDRRGHHEPVITASAAGRTGTPRPARPDARWSTPRPGRVPAVPPGGAPGRRG